VGNIVLRDRQTLAQHGIIIVTAVTENSTGELISGPEIITRGFVYVKESEELIEDCRQIIIGTFNSCRLRKIRDKVKLRTCIREELSDYIWKRMKRDPMILPIIMEV
jgi:ribonuclease J